MESLKFDYLAKSLMMLDDALFFFFNKQEKNCQVSYPNSLLGHQELISS